MDKKVIIKIRIDDFRHKKSFNIQREFENAYVGLKALATWTQEDKDMGLRYTCLDIKEIA